METLPEAATDFDQCYRALASRDARFDGLFFTAVTTTGIYCRSVCPARTPKRSSCQFFATAAAAESAGFRPCLRCRPELAPARPGYADTLASDIVTRLGERAGSGQSLETIAAQVGLSSRQLRRLISDTYGASPMEIVRTHRLLLAKRLLHDTELPMTDVALGSGFGSLRRFNDAFVSRYGIAPGQLRRNRPSEPATFGGGMLELKLSYRTPMDLSACFGYLKARALSGIERVDSNTWRRTVVVSSANGPRAGEIAVHRSKDDVLVLSLSHNLLPALGSLTQRVRQLFDLNANPAAIEAHLAMDPALKPLVDRRPGLRMPGAWDPFELAVRAVLGQQVSVAAASTLCARLIARFARPLANDGGAFEGADPLSGEAPLRFQPLSPDDLVDASPASLTSIGITSARANTLKQLAAFAKANGFAKAAETRTLEGFEATLCELDGIGPWTAQYIALRALRHPDAFPAADLGLLRAARALGLPDTPRGLLAHAERWRPWRAYATAHLWHHL